MLVTFAGIIAFAGIGTAIADASTAIPLERGLESRKNAENEGVRENRESGGSWGSGESRGSSERELRRLEGGGAAMARAKVYLPNGDGHYNYAPAIIRTEDAEYAWWCQNPEPYVITDHIFFAKRPTGGEWEPRRSVLAPGEPGEWDSEHVCDPAVVAGEFRYEGETYRYALFFLGTDQRDNNHNQLGVAFAKNLEGPWVKFAGNPIVTADRDVWGVGQPAVTSVDGKGRLLLFYSVGGRWGTYVARREVDFSDMTNPVLGRPVEVVEGGLTSRDGSREILHNIDIVYDPARDRFFMVRPRHPFDPEWPNFIETELQLAAIGAEGIWQRKGEWEVIGGVGPADTGYPRNHNAGLVRTEYGTLPDLDRLEVVFAVAETGERWLWSYQLHHVVRSIK